MRFDAPHCEDINNYPNIRHVHSCSVGIILTLHVVLILQRSWCRTAAKRTGTLISHGALWHARQSLASARSSRSYATFGMSTRIDGELLQACFFPCRLHIRGVVIVRRRFIASACMGDLLVLCTNGSVNRVSGWQAGKQSPATTAEHAASTRAGRRAVNSTRLPQLTCKRVQISPRLLVQSCVFACL